MPTILVAEADSFYAKLYSLNLKKKGFSVDMVLSGDKALEFLKEKPYDALLMNVMLPFQDGFSLLEKLKQLKKKIPPVVVATELRQPEDLKRAKTLGINDYFIKEESQISDIIKRVVEISGGVPPVKAPEDALQKSLPKPPSKILPKSLPKKTSKKGIKGL